MTGICAGDVQQVQLGDLVVAERAFTYDNGKFILDDEGRVVHQRDTMTYQLNAVSANFLASDFIACYELPRLLSRAEDGGTLILPIILSPCLFHETDLKVFQAVNSPYKSLAAMKFADREQIWVQVAEIIKKRRTLNSM